MIIKNYRVEDVTAVSRVAIFTTPDRNQAIEGAKARAKQPGKAVHVTQVSDIGEREVAYRPDGTIAQLWKEYE